MAIDPERLLDALEAGGVAFGAGVPCSILDPLTRAAERRGRHAYVPTTVEGEALALAAGAWLGGSLGVVLMQNSGLGNVVNPLASLCLPYGIPALLVVSWRGEPGTVDALHHAPMGRATRELLALFDVRCEVLRCEEDVPAAITGALAVMARTRRPAALLVPRGALARGSATPAPRSPRGRAAPPAEPRVFGGGQGPCTRDELVGATFARFRDARAIATTGHMARAVAACVGPERAFPMQGSMGFATAIALGLALARPAERVLVLDGDGALLMRLGSLATAGALAPQGLVHIVADNAAYASTGGQRSLSPGVDFARVAAACGYARTAVCEGAEGLTSALDWAGAAAGPTLLHVLMDPRDRAPEERPELGPQAIAAAFRAASLEAR